MTRPALLPRVPLAFTPRAPEELGPRARGFADELIRRRTVRDFSDRPVPRAAIEAAIDAARHAPSGANQQPWHFVAVSDPTLKRAIRIAAEKEERAFYADRASQEWLDALAPLGTDADKPFLEIAPWLIVCFAEQHGRGKAGEKIKNYYVPESVGIACGFLIATLHMAGLATLTHTPSPMGFLRDLLGRPANEKAWMIVVAGHPAPGATVPAITKKPLARVATFR